MSDNTEAPTPRRLQRAREAGQVPMSREFVQFASLAGGLGALAVQILAAGQGPLVWFGGMLRGVGGDPGLALHRAIWRVVAAVTPVALGAGGAAAAATLLQTGFLLHGGAMAPDFSRISPVRGVARLFGLESVVSGLKSLVKVGVFSAFLWMALRRVWPALVGAPFWRLPWFVGQIERQCALLCLPMLGLAATLALADLFWVRLLHARRLRMTRDEIRDEQKDTDGNPLVKGRLRQVARQRARRRMMAAVPKAAVVLTNPTHYAVALAYERGSRAAPRLVAKGADEVAERIRQIARENNVPLVANPPLARALYRIELDTEIPPEHFRAVAEVIAYVWRMRSRAGRL